MKGGKRLSMSNYQDLYQRLQNTSCIARRCPGEIGRAERSIFVLKKKSSYSEFHQCQSKINLYEGQSSESYL